MHPFLPQQHLFRAYDIRGDYRYFTDDFVSTLARCFAQHYINADKPDSHPQKRQQKQHQHQQTADLYANDCETTLSRHTVITKQVTSHPIKVVLGYDVRHGSLSIAQHLATRLVQQGIQVIWLGLVTTPMMVYWANQYQGHGIIVTASHSVKRMTGIKWLTFGTSATAKQIQSLYYMLAVQPIIINTSEYIKNNWQTTKSKLCDTSNTVVTSYCQGIQRATTQLVYQHAKQNNKPVSQQSSQQPSQQSAFQSSYTPLIDTLVIDCLHGATAVVAASLFKHFAKRVIMLNDTPDANFPKGNPDPTEQGRLTELQQTVLQHQANLGIAFDGDGDRLMVVDEMGRVANTDDILFILAKATVTHLNADHINATSHQQSKQYPKAPQCETKQRYLPQVMFDVKCSHHLPNMLNTLAVHPVMSKTGSSYMRQAMQTSSKHRPVIFAGELSGHYIFNDGLFIPHDDGMYAAVRLMYWLYSQGQPLSIMLSKLPSSISTTDIYIRIDDQQQSVFKKLISVVFTWLNELKRAPKNLPNYMFDMPDMPVELLQSTKLTMIDGIRLDFAHGFGIIRQSNTSKSLTVRFAGDTLADLIYIQQEFVRLCRQLDTQLANKIAKIKPNHVPTAC